ncbi:MAG TPA: tRNA (adenosine(37)-N6)-threonylcarbamoyltransferase complex dimerization subunit type 1 TsaB [Edaphobacter sp.]|uniref:tRNA (adenosine(37)-N6)-threonylcarbamoyltransferase complex dimerization subunit type 1 TsaB n=1 Tax=Edaphobacter sp. TaxID=1934404 RepID=UPI002B8C799E|nr:tRNA (adenosine(37)-N6)-threonylcarbamoyltransferase complex dimerization subunit type 1 TsaB [Edaphobacter sp.]HUZ93745.1 tRNA (adenosine(37)-N6)-threonylcarbamoyltransferase complex dimerization subunit type 1 TsaB [Edaphobacter sp.]
MRFLLIDTCGSEGSVALADTSLAGAVIAVEVLPGRTASERLVPAVRRVMEASGFRLGDLTAVVVAHGPGSFTGVRVGLSAAKGLSEAGGVPLIAVSQLALLAASAAGEVVYAVLDAGRGEFYLGEYEGHECLREALLTGEEVLAAATGGTVVVCEAKVAEALVELKPRVVAEPRAEDVLPFAVERAAAGRFDDAALLDANYLRRTDAEIFAKPKSALR